MERRAARLIRLAFAMLALAMLSLGLAATAPVAAASRASAWSGTLSEASALYVRGHYAAAARLLVPRAEAGDAGAQGMLGFLYEQGQGVPQDFAAAFFYYSCAAEQGEATAQYLLGLLYDKGRGVPRDVVLAQKWLILASARTDGKQREVYARIRDAVATKMTKLQIRLAQDLASQWLPVPSMPLR